LVTGVGLPHCFKWLPLGEVPVVLGVRERKATLYPSPSREYPISTKSHKVTPSCAPHKTKFQYYESKIRIVEESNGIIRILPYPPPSVRA